MTLRIVVAIYTKLLCTKVSELQQHCDLLCHVSFFLDAASRSGRTHGQCTLEEFVIKADDPSVCWNVLDLPKLIPDHTPPWLTYVITVLLCR